MNVISQLEFELTYKDITVHYVIGTLPGVIAMKGGLHSSELKPYYQMQFRIILSIHHYFFEGGFYSFAEDTVGIF